MVISFLAHPFHFLFLTVPKGVCVSEGVEFKVGLLPDTSFHGLMQPESEFYELVIVNNHIRNKIKVVHNCFLPLTLCVTGNINE